MEKDENTEDNKPEQSNQAQRGPNEQPLQREQGQDANAKDDNIGQQDINAEIKNHEAQTERD